MGVGDDAVGARASRGEEPREICRNSAYPDDRSRKPVTEGRKESTGDTERDKSLISGGSDPGEGTGERRKRGGFVARAPEELQAFPFAAVEFSGRYGWGR